MGSQVTQINQPKSLMITFATKYGVDPAKMMDILKNTAFKVKNGEATDEQMAALVIVANQHGLNPFTKEIYAFPDKNNGIVPVVGVDGWLRIINDHVQYDGMEFNESEEIIEMPGAKPSPTWIECIMYRKDRSRPTKIKEYLDEVYQGPRGNYSGPWQSHTKRFLRHKAIIQAARVAFSFSGIYDEDEAERIIDGGVVESEIIHKSVIKSKNSDEQSAEKSKFISQGQADMIKGLMEKKTISADDLAENFNGITSVTDISGDIFDDVIEWVEGF